MVDLLDDYPTIEDLKVCARRRMPRLAWEQLDSGTAGDRALARNREALDEILFCPRISAETITLSLQTTLFGRDFDVPFGIAPVGATGLFWPDAEHVLARTAARNNLPYCYSSVSCETPETVGPLAGDTGWFQLYPPFDEAVRDDLLQRARASGFQTLVVTVDVPQYGLRERPRRAGLRTPPRWTARTIAQVLARPHWAAATLRHGAPRFRALEAYLEDSSAAEAADYVLTKLHRRVDAAYLAAIRAQWSGPIVLKGILHPEDARAAVAQGADGIVVSNHGGRQCDAAPAAIAVLPDIVAAVGDATTVIFDSGVRSGLDVARALALGADFVLLGRAFIYGVAALGERGGDHVCRILTEDLRHNMIQMGVADVDAFKATQTFG